MSRRLILIGGTAGSGKTSVARTLSRRPRRRLAAARHGLDRDEGRRPGFARVRVARAAGRMRGGGDSDDELLIAHVASSQAVCEALPAVFNFEIETHSVVVADGAWLLPSFVAALELPETEVCCVFLHADVNGVAAALAPRLGGRPAEERHIRMNRRIWQ